MKSFYYVKTTMPKVFFCVVVDDAEQNRAVFRRLRELSIDIKLKNADNVTMNVLSMGMTGDYRVAIEEGATMVRVGTGIFGMRQIGE